MSSVAMTVDRNGRNVSKNRHKPKYSPKRLPGRWSLGFAMDMHTVSSTFVGHDEFGHEQFETERTFLGDLLYRLKYDDDRSALPLLATVVSDFVKRRLDPDVIVPVPPTRKRSRQPVRDIAEKVGQILSIPVIHAIQKSGASRELKAVHGYTERMKLLDSAIRLTRAAGQIKGKRVVLFDDLWRSVATLNAAANILTDKAEVGKLMVLTITKTRSNR